MSSLEITRRSRSFPVVVATSVAESQTIDLGEFAGASLIIDSNPSSNATKVEVFAAGDLTATPTDFARLAPITLARPSGQISEVVTAGTTTTLVFTATFTTLAGVYKLPDDIFATRVIRLVSDAALGTSVATVLVAKS